MWPFNKPKDKINCFFCKIEVDKYDAFMVEYKSVDGTGNVNICPMCAGMLDDMIIKKDETFND